MSSVGFKVASRLSPLLTSALSGAGGGYGCGFRPKLAAMAASAASFSTNPSATAISSSMAAKEVPGHAVMFQPDYTLGSQFAGVAVAWAEGLYASRGLDVTILPPCPSRPGDEISQVEKIQSASGTSVLAVGTTEQNVLVAAQAKGANVRGVSAMLQRTPLALGALPHVKMDCLADLKGKRIGMARDEAPLLKVMAGSAGLEGVTIVEVTHEGKQEELLSGRVDAIQIYDTTEVVELHNKIGQPLVVLPIGQQPYDRGYAQVVFASTDAVANVQLRTPLRNFLEATYEGWQRAAVDPWAAAEAVTVMTSEERSVEVLRYHHDVLLRFLPYLQPTSCATSTTALLPSSFALGSVSATRWLSVINGYVDAGLSAPSAIRTSVSETFDVSLWPPVPLFPTPGSKGGCVSVDGRAVAAQVRAEAAASAAMALKLYGRKPCLAVLRFGAMDAVEAFRRREVAAKQATSWYCMDVVGRAVGVDVQLVRLADSVSENEAIAAVDELAASEGVDAVMVEMPLPCGVSYDVLMERVECAKRVDALDREALGGIMFPTQSSPHHAVPVSPTSILELLKRVGVVLRGQRVAVVGRGRLVGAPLVQMLLDAGATVSICSGATPAASLRELCVGADIIVSAAGIPGLITKEHVRPGAVVVNVGTTFDETRDILLPDVSTNVAERASMLVGCPGGVGPIPVNVLLRSVAANAHKRLGPLPPTKD